VHGIGLRALAATSEAVDAGGRRGVVPGRAAGCGAGSLRSVLTVETVLEFCDVSKRFGPIVAADHVSLSVRRGEIFSLLGPSGCGKTTLLRMVAGFERPDSGRVLLNGVDITDRLRAVLPRPAVLYGGVFISSAIQGPGIVKQVAGTGQLFFGPADPADVEKYRPIETLLKDAGIKAELSADALLPLWTKYIFIGPLAGVTSLTGKPFGGVLGGVEERAMVEGMMKEVEAVARRKGVRFPPDIVQASLGKAEAFAPATKTSMQLDYERGNPTELDIFIAYMVEAGEKLGIPVPLHRKVYAELRMRK